MKAILFTKYGSPDGLQLGEAEKPTPQDNEVLIRTAVATATAGDSEIRRLKVAFWIRLPLQLYIGFFRPTRVPILGMEVAGEIEAVGKDVTLFKGGDQVVASTGFRFGAYAEYVNLPENTVMAIKPATVSYEEAAPLIVGGINALHFIRVANIQSGQKVLINGAGGGIGTYALQLAKLAGAEVTGVDSTEKLDMLRSIGADHVIDYTQEDFTKNGETYDVIFDTAGNSSFSRSMRSLNENGFYLLERV